MINIRTSMHRRWSSPQQYHNMSMLRICRGMYAEQKAPHNIPNMFLIVPMKIAYIRAEKAVLLNSPCMPSDDKFVKKQCACAEKPENVLPISCPNISHAIWTCSMGALNDNIFQNWWLLEICSCLLYANEISKPLINLHRKYKMQSILEINKNNKIF